MTCGKRRIWKVSPFCDAQEIDVLDPGREVSLKREHNVLVIPQLPAPKWVKIGKVTSLRAYPLVSGKEYPVDECEVRFDEMYMFENGIQMRWDRWVRNSDIYFLNELSTSKARNMYRREWYFCVSNNRVQVVDHSRQFILVIVIDRAEFG